MSALEVEVAAKRFDSPPTQAIEGLSLRAEAGEFVAVVGPSGAGKSTLLNIVAGLDRDYEGRVAGAGDEHRLAFVFQTPRLMPWLSVRDNLRLVLPEGQADDARLDALLGELGLAGFEEAWPRQLSGGMQRRVALARAFAIEPQLLLMDEPFVSLDDPLAWRLRGMLLDYWQAHRPTVLYVTHDLTEALALADRVLFFSARPARVVLDHRVAMPRPRRPEQRALADYRHALLQAHPALLEGLVKGDFQRPDGGDDKGRSSAA